VTSMDRSEYNFQRCKLCGEIAAKPTYDLGNSSVYSCQNCDFHFLNQLDYITESLRDSKPLTDESRKYIESRIHEGAQLHPARMDLVQKHINLNNCKVLDIGAGLGQFQRLLNNQGAETQGIEPSRIRREYVREKFGIRLHHELINDTYWQSGFAGYFDLITLWDVIEHVDFPCETLEFAIKVLKPNGMLFLETPSREVLSYKLSQQVYRLSAGKISLFLPSFYSPGLYGHKQIFTHDQIIGLLKQFGLEIICSKHSYSTSLLRGNKIILGGCKTKSSGATNNS
ncbi:MAG: class I SAM-dependent methyltransferase, partial [Desulfuromusa sp.]|nr:class I SAM-dependent methyltransferase [Desulfuromusa sp.]